MKTLALSKLSFAMKLKNEVLFSTFGGGCFALDFRQTELLLLVGSIFVTFSYETFPLFCEDLHGATATGSFCVFGQHKIHSRAQFAEILNGAHVVVPILLTKYKQLFVKWSLSFVRTFVKTLCLMSHDPFFIN